MGIIGVDSILFLISVLGHHQNDLERKKYTKQSLTIGRLFEDMRGDNW